MYLRRLSVLLLATIVGIIPLSVVNAASGSNTPKKRVVIVSKRENKVDTDTTLKKYKHQKLKKLSNLNNAEVVLVDDAELSKLKGDCSVQVFDDALIKAPKPKKGSI